MCIKCFKKWKKKKHLTRLDVDICGGEERVQSQLAMMNTFNS